MEFFATVAKGLNAVLMAELQDLGAGEVAERPAGVVFQGDLSMAYRACLWSRTASRILLPLTRFTAATPEQLYAGAREVDWATHLNPEGRFCIDANVRSSAIRHSHFAALKVKDAVVDQYRERSGQRPDVDVAQPDIRLQLFIYKDQATLSLDLSGESLHKRGYRHESVIAPMKENLAAAILLRSGWKEIAASGGTLVDPMCGSGTLLLEAAMIAGNIAPGLQRTSYGFDRWLQHDQSAWETLLEEAQQAQAWGRAAIPGIYGYDHDRRAVHAALANVQVAGLDDKIYIERRELSALSVSSRYQPGLVIVNPPYGERLGEQERLKPLYQQLGARLKSEFEGWQAAVFTGNPDLGKHMGLRAVKQHNLYNGALACRLLRFVIEPSKFISYAYDERGVVIPRVAEEKWRPGAVMFANRLRKNLKESKKWAQRENVDCYRIYDADMPEYAVAIDLYHSEEGQRWIYVQEYEAPKKVDEKKARQRFDDALMVLPQVLDVEAVQIYVKVRKRQKGLAQYEKVADERNFIAVRERGHRFWVNLSDYLDTGLFLDHRLTRQQVGTLSKDKHMLNLFCYTASVSVYAAAAGARSTTSVDMSNTYIDWAKRNFALNKLQGDQHVFVQSDCIAWLRKQRTWQRAKYDVIFLDPPTFSSSKRMASSFDIQRQHVELIKDCMVLLADEGVLIFSNNYRKFRLDETALSLFQVEDISAQTIPKDYARNAKIHRCWKVRHH